jgi:alpha-glucosidase
MRLTTLKHFSPVPNTSGQFASPHGETLQIQVLNHDLIRVRFYPEGKPRLDRTWTVAGANGDVPREGRRRDDLSPFPQPTYESTSDEQQTVIQTEALTLVIHHEALQLQWYDRAGKRFAADLKHRAYTYDRSGRSVFHYLERCEDEHYYGFGERAGALDKQGMRFRMMNVDALGYNAETSDPLYKHWPFYITYIPELNIAYGLFYDNLATTVFDLGKEVDALWGYYRYWMAEDGDLDYYLIYGPSIEAVIEKFTALTGRPALLPRWALGYLGSTMSYTEASDAQVQLRRFAQLCQQHDIPCDLFHLSSGYTTSDEGLRYVFNWNRQRVPEPEQMVQSFHDAGIRLAPNIKPYLLTTHPQYEKVKALGGLMTDPDTGEPALSRFWSGGAFENAEGAYVDFTSQAGFAWWRGQAQDVLLAIGIDGLWNDNNEFELWDDDALCQGFGQPFRLGLGRAIQTLLMARSSYEASQNQYPDLRPFILSRAGVAGIQRYVQTWTGDNTTSWHTLKYNIPMGLGMGLSGMPNVGHDVGGFFGPAPDAELFARWVQNGVFHPRFTIHSWNTDGTVNEPWMYPEVLPIIREAIHFRYRLLPYLYTLMFEAHESGHPIIRPLVYHFSDDPRCRAESFDFLLGEHLLVVAVFEPGARKRRVYLPTGKDWCDFYSGQWYAGGQEIEVDAPLERIPLFVSDGGMIPMGKRMRYIGEQADDVREVFVFARSDARFTLVEDDGASLDYQRGGYSKVELRLTLEGGQWVASATRLRDGFSLPYSQITFVLASDSPYPVKDGVFADGRWRVTVDVQG